MKLAIIFNPLFILLFLFPGAVYSMESEYEKISTIIKKKSGCAPHARLPEIVVLNNTIPLLQFLHSRYISNEKDLQYIRKKQTELQSRKEYLKKIGDSIELLLCLWTELIACIGHINSLNSSVSYSHNYDKDLTLHNIQKKYTLIDPSGYSYNTKKLFTAINSEFLQYNIKFHHPIETLQGARYFLEIYSARIDTSSRIIAQNISVFESLDTINSTIKKDKFLLDSLQSKINFSYKVEYIPFNSTPNQIVNDLFAPLQELNKSNYITLEEEEFFNEAGTHYYPIDID